MKKNALRTLEDFCVTHILGECYHKWVGEGVTMDEVHSVCQKCALEHWKLGQTPPQRTPTTNPADAMDVLKMCLGKPLLLEGELTITKEARNYWVRAICRGHRFDGEAPTLELAICLFAKELWKEIK